MYILRIAGEKKFHFLEACASCFEADNFFELLTEIMIRGCEFDLSNPMHSRLLHKALTGPLVDESMKNMVEMNHQYMAQLLRKGIERHQVRDDADLDMMVFFLNSMTIEFAKYVASKAQVTYFGDLYHPQKLGTVKDMDLPAIIRDLVKLIKSGLSPVKKH